MKEKEENRKETTNKEFYGTVQRIAVKYAKMVEKRIDNTQTGLRGTDLREIYDGIQMLGNITATLERLSHIG